MINTLFVEWISRQNQLLCRKYLVEETFDHLPGNEKDQLSPTCSYGTWRLETPQYDDTQSQSIYKRTWKWGKTPERNSTTCEWISPTCREKPKRQCSTTIHCQRNLISHIRQKKIIVFIIWPAKIRVCPAKKIFGRSSWPATCCPLFWALMYHSKLWLSKSFFATLGLTLKGHEAGLLHAYWVTISGGLFFCRCSW